MCKKPNIPDELLALRGKIDIDYDWEHEEETELANNRPLETIPGLTVIKEAP